MWSVPFWNTDFFHLFYCFVIYSFAGWVWESALVSIQTKEWVNRGFMNGPFCPIYGVGATCVYLLLMPYRKYPVFIFLGGFFLATSLEYIAGALLEKLFHTAWWDYKDKKWNIKGRVYLGASLAWGVMSLLLIYVMHPAVFYLVNSIPALMGEWIGTLILLYFIVDITVTVNHILHLNERLKNLTVLLADIREWIGTFHLQEAGEELREKLERLSFSELLKDYKEKQKDKVIFAQENLESVEQEKGLSLEYIFSRIKLKWDFKKRVIQENTAVEKRLLRAFPKMRSIQFESALEDLKHFLKIVKKDESEKKEHM